MKLMLSTPAAGDEAVKPPGAAGAPTTVRLVASDQSPQLLGVPARARKRHRPVLDRLKELVPALVVLSTSLQVVAPLRWAAILRDRGHVGNTCRG